ncbi:hypothetical protein C9J85_01775 [Haloferax sp. wsp5]|nr:hypothetical protein C9J85_01775 [Haloferax sp. wsp5]
MLNSRDVTSRHRRTAPLALSPPRFGPPHAHVVRGHPAIPRARPFSVLPSRYAPRHSRVERRQFTETFGTVRRNRTTFTSRLRAYR